MIPHLAPYLANYGLEPERFSRNSSTLRSILILSFLPKLLFDTALEQIYNS
jgi:hypothetical protein